MVASAADGSGNWFTAISQGRSTDTGSRTIFPVKKPLMIWVNRLISNHNKTQQHATGVHIYCNILYGIHM